MGQLISKTKPAVTDPNLVPYSVNIKTSDAYAEAGTESTVFMEFVGANGMTSGWLELHRFISEDFERGQVNHFTVPAKDVGLPIIVRIKLENKHGADEWLCERIVVRYMGQRAEFPIYDWIEETAEVTIGDAMLPQKVTNEYVKTLRKQEINRRKGMFAWSPRPARNEIGWGMNRLINSATYDDLPKFLKRDEVRYSDLQKTRFTALFHSYVQRITNLLNPLDSLEDYHRLYEHHSLERAKANATDDWDTDEGMGRLVLNGISPLSFKRVTSLPEKFTVTNEDVAGSLRSGTTLEEEMQAGRIYLSDYDELLGGVPRNTDLEDQPIYCADSCGLFYVNAQDNFVPIAIQLVPGDRDYLFTPADNEHDWLLAKIHFRCSEGNYHQWITHYFHTHGIVEVFSTSLFRCLPISHPVYKLLRPHVKNVTAINIDARVNLIPPTGRANKALAVSASELVRKCYKTFHLDDITIPKRLKKLGLDDPELLPKYYYRDDVLEMWDLMRKYVAAVIKHYYKCDEDVVGDFELQDWIQDVAKEGIGWQDGNYRGVPDKIESVELLIDLCLTIMFTSSAQHAAVNFGQFDTYKFIPSATGGMIRPPHKRGEGSLDMILKSLPGVRMSGTFIAFAFILSTYSESEVFLGDFPQRLFTEEAILNFQQSFRDDLAAYAERKKERNAGLEHPYIYLLPERIPNGTSI